MFLFRLQNYIFFLFTAIFYSLFSIFWKTWEQKNKFFLKDKRTEEQVFFERHENRRTCFIPQPKNMFFCSSVLPLANNPMFFCSSVLPLASNPQVLMFSCLTPRTQSPGSSVLLSYPSQTIPMFSCSSVFPKKHVLLSNYHAHFSYSN